MPTREKSVSNQELYSKINKAAAKLLLRDQARLKRRLHLIRQEKDPAKLAAFLEYLQTLATQNLFAAAEKLRCDIPGELPISANASEILDLLKKHQVIIVCGETGSGKTTQLPKLAVAYGCGRKGRIGCTQPRRIAASALARRVASETGTALGEGVGYKVRFDDMTSNETVVKFMTDGILLAETVKDPLLWQYDCIILDEVHERSLNIDFLLGYLKNILSRRRDLKVIISSATLESEKISGFFDSAPVVQVEGKLYPIEDYYLENSEEELAVQVWHGVEFLLDAGVDGDILVFLPGEREIRDCASYLEGKQLKHCEILPLFGRLAAASQQKVFSPGKMRRVVLSTNVAETSVTIPGIHAVIDSGLVRLSRYNPRTRIQELQIEAVSKASCRQRRGRCGRIAAGVCVHLYSENDMAGFADYTPPEIQRSALSGVILQMAELGLPPLEKFPLVDPPSPAGIREGRETLADLLALDKNGRLTECGHKLARIPLDPHLGKMLLAAAERKVLPEIIVIAAFLSIPDFRERPFESEKAADTAHRKFHGENSDFGTILNIHHALVAAAESNNALKKFCVQNYFNYRRVREFRNLVADLRDLCREMGICKDIPEIDMKNISWDSIHKSILSALPRHLGILDRESRLYSDYKGKKFTVFPASTLAKCKNLPDCLLFFSLVETSRIFSRINAGIKANILEEVAPHVCKKSYTAPYYDASSGFVYAREKVSLGAIVIHHGRRCHYGNAAPAEAREIFIREGLLENRAGESECGLDAFYKTYDDLQYLEIKLRHPGAWLDKESIFSHFDKVLPVNVNSVKSLQQWHRQKHIDFAPRCEIMLAQEVECMPDAQDWPDEMIVADEIFPVKYEFDPGSETDGATVQVPQDKLDLLDKSIVSFAVPGILAETVSFYFHSMPTVYRRKIHPVNDAVEKFMVLYRQGRIFTGVPLTEALAGFVEENFSAGIAADIFENIALPEFLQLKIAVVGKNGRIVEIITDLPQKNLSSSLVNRHIPAADKYTLSGCSAWAGNDLMPESVKMTSDGSVQAFPAQTFDGNNYGRALFLVKQEAEFSHHRALLALFRNDSTAIKYLRSSLRISNEMKLTFFLDYPEWKEDFTDFAVKEAMGGELWNIRSNRDFQAAKDSADQELYSCGCRIMDLLQKTLDGRQEVVSLLRKLGHCREICDEIQQDMDFIFRPGFLSTPAVVERSERYMKAFRLRLQRAIAMPQKDLAKIEPVIPYCECFYLTCDNIEKVLPYSDMEKFFMLLMEAKIAATVPEMRTLEKCSISVLAERWEALKI